MADVLLRAAHGRAAYNAVSRTRRNTAKLLRDTWDDRLLRRVSRFIRNGGDFATLGEWGPLHKAHVPLKPRG